MLFLPKIHVSSDASILFAITSQTPTIAANCFYNIIPNLPSPRPKFKECLFVLYLPSNLVLGR